MTTRPEMEGAVCVCGHGYGMHRPVGMHTCRLCLTCLGFVFVGDVK